MKNSAPTLCRLYDLHKHSAPIARRTQFRRAPNENGALKNRRSESRRKSTKTHTVPAPIFTQPRKGLLKTGPGAPRKTP